MDRVLEWQILLFGTSVNNEVFTDVPKSTPDRSVPAAHAVSGQTSTYAAQQHTYLCIKEESIPYGKAGEQKPDKEMHMDVKEQESSGGKGGKGNGEEEREGRSGREVQRKELQMHRNGKGV